MMPAMAPFDSSRTLLSNAWDVLVLFVVPIGGGIPAGVVLAQKRGLGWALMEALYFLSDVVLACAFEPLMLLFLRASRRNPRLARMREALARSTGQALGRYGIRPGPFSLVMITFGTDPMTGRSVAKAAGHGFFTGWALTIAGDMLFFTVLMASTLWLNDFLGNGTWAAVLVTVAVVAIPPLARSLRRRWGRARPAGLP
jgi:hypothetical protein